MLRNNGFVRAVLLLFLLFIVAVSAGCQRASRTPVGAEQSAWVLTVRHSDVYRLPATWLSKGASSGTLRLGDHTLPVWRAENGSISTAFFYAPVTATRQSTIGALFWRAAPAAHPFSPRPLRFIDGHTSQTNTLNTLWREEDRLYKPKADQSVPWFWTELEAPARWLDGITLPSGAQPCTLTLQLWGMTAMAANPDHHLRVFWDDDALADARWDGAGMRVLRFALSRAAAGGCHTILLQAPGDSGAPADVVFLDRWGVTYRRDLDVRQAAVTWQADAKAARLHVSSGRPLWLLDITSSLAPVAYGPAVPGSSWVTLATTPRHRYWAGTVAQMPFPAARHPLKTLSTAALADLAAADEVVIGANSYLDTARPLLALRREQGLTVATLTPRQLFDGWGRGVPGLDAWRNFVAWREAHGTPLRFLLLLGDANAAPWDSDSDALTTIVPTAFVRTTFLGETPSDAALVASASLPVAVGRMPVRSVAEVKAIVAKTIAYEKSTQPRRQLLLSDASPEFAPFADAIAAFWERQDGPVVRFRADVSSARPNLLETLVAGPAWLHYVGHGSPLLWSQQKVLTADDAGHWHDPALVCAWTCLNGYFILPERRSLAERWLLVPQGGAVAIIAPAGEGGTDQERLFAAAFYRALLTNDRLGAALAAARAAPGQQEMGLQYLLFGDPALRINWARMAGR